MTGPRARWCQFGLLLVASLGVAAAGQQTSPDTNWPSFRGPNAAGVADGHFLPAAWDVPSSKNVRWKTPIPGLGHSSPTVWGDRLYVSTAFSGAEKPELKVGMYGDVASLQENTTHRWVVYCLDKRSGKILWERTVHEGVPQIQRHPKSSHANSTLATDGRYLIAFFGSEGLYALDMNGRPLWKRDFGVLESSFFDAPDAQWGFGSSPIIHGNLVIIQVDVLKGSFLAALNIKDGTDAWRTPRADVPTWGTPTIYGDGPAAQVIVNGFRHVGGYDIRTGREIWRLSGGGDIPVPTPVVGHGLVFITSAHGSASPVYAIRTSARGDISLEPNESSNEFVAWRYPREGAYMSTPVVYGDYLYNCRWNGVLVCYEARTGKHLYQERLGGSSAGFSASPVAGDGKIYVPSEDGDVYVVKAGPTFEVLATNAMGEICMATPAISAGVIYFRTRSLVVAVAAGR
jgi:outer membrane protein assembly factor BamB